MANMPNASKYRPQNTKPHVGHQNHRSKKRHVRHQRQQEESLQLGGIGVLVVGFVIGMIIAMML